MPTGTTFNAIYLGNFADLEAPAGTTGAYSDVDTSYAIAEANAGVLLGSYDHTDLQIVEITAYHRAEDTVIGLDSYPSSAYNNGQEGVEYSVDGGNTVGDGSVSTTTTPLGTPPPDYGTATGGIAIDNEVYYNATVTYYDSGSDSLVDVSKIVAVFQTDTGDVFLQEYLNSNSSSFNLDGLSISGIRLDSVYSNDVDAVVYDSWSITGASIIPCFTSGTQISTPNGDRAIEELCVGDLIVTRDDGFQKLCWCGSRRLSRKHLELSPFLFPVRISAGALGPGLPARDLLVSPQHRILLSSKISVRMFGEPEILVAAKHLIDLDGVEIEQNIQRVTYYHLLFDRHQILRSNGTWTESLFLGQQALRSLPAAALEEIFALFPEFRGNTRPLSTARAVVPGRRARSLVRRHKMNENALINLS